MVVHFVSLIFKDNINYLYRVMPAGKFEVTIFMAQG